MAFRNRLKYVKSLADFCFDICKELIAYGEVLDKRYVMGNSGAGGNSARNVGQVAIPRINRLKFFNSPPGLTIRMNTTGHFP